MRKLFEQIEINDWSDLPEIEGRYWTTNRNKFSATMIEKYIDPSDNASRGFWRATVGTWLKPITNEEATND